MPDLAGCLGVSNDCVDRSAAGRMKGRHMLGQFGVVAAGVEQRGEQARD